MDTPTFLCPFSRKEKLFSSFLIKKIIACIFFVSQWLLKFFKKMLKGFACRTFLSSSNEIQTAEMFRMHDGVGGEWKIKKAIFAPSFMFHELYGDVKKRNNKLTSNRYVCVCFKALMCHFVFTLVCVMLIRISHLSFGFCSLTCCCTFVLITFSVKLTLWEFKSF